MTYKETYVPGDWAAICDQCGMKYKASQLRKRYDGFMVCSADWETRHPQEFVRAVPDNRPLPWTRPEAPDQFISVTYNPLTLSCSVFGHFSQADYAEADCAIVGDISPNL